MSIHIVEEARRCLNCRVPGCQNSCPIHTPIPKVIQLFNKNKLMEAGRLLFDNNPLSLFCSIVCNHEKQCAGGCVRGKKDTPVHFSSIESYISDMYLDRMVVRNKTDSALGKAAVIGSGPAGITAAIRLASFGYPVTVFEWKSHIGGMLRYGIPEFRLHKDTIDRYQKLMEEMGIMIRTNTTIGTVLKIDDLFRDGYKSVFIGTGAEKPKSLGIRGESLGNVHYALNYLANPETHKLGRSVAVIGVGNAAMDVARTAFRYGVQKVTLYAMGTDIAASSSELTYAQLDGAEIKTGMRILEITEEGPVFVKTESDENGTGTKSAQHMIQEHVDSTIIAISQVPRSKLVRTTNGLMATDSGLLITDECYMTTKKGIFAAGDVITGAKTVVHAVAGAKEAADKMKIYME